MVTKYYYEKFQGSSKAKVGEIDTSVPFQSVKDAVSLFGQGAFSGEKSSIKKTKPQSAEERVLAKEMQFHLTQKELNRLNEQLKNAETTKSQALFELEKAKLYVEDLTQKRKVINESKVSSIRTTEAVVNQFTAPNTDNNSKRTNEYSNTDLESKRVEYMAAVTELDALKQELLRTRQEHNASSEAKAISEKQEAEAEDAAKANAGRSDELSEEIASVRGLTQKVKLGSVQAEEDGTKIHFEKDEHKRFYIAKLGNSVNKLHAMRNDIDAEVVKSLETRMAETLCEVKDLRSEMESTKSSDLDSVNTVTTELTGAKESLHKVAEEESSLRIQVKKLKLELDNIKNDHFALKDKEAETESIADGLHVKLQKAKSELEEALVEEARIRSVCDEMMASVRKLASESENTEREAQETKQKAEELRREAEATRIKLEAAEKKLEAAVDEAEEAKSAEAIALHQIRRMSEEANAARTLISESGARITISKEEFESLNRKVEESKKLAGMKVEAAIAQVEAVKASENEALKRLESTRKEIEDTNSRTRDALRRAEMAEAAKKAVEGELRRWRGREGEEKKAVEIASRVLEETEKSFELPASSYKIQQSKTIAKERVVEVRKLEKAMTSVAKKALRMPSLSSFFLRKKNRVKGGSPSFLPGEKPVW
ncbi:hypothetical protein OROGR_000435 [Orobanche gracilis]